MHMKKPTVIVESMSSPNSPSDGNWTPEQGEEVDRFLDAMTIPQESKEQLRSTSTSILSMGISPDGSGDRQETGLVVGYVQSGKTMSFEAVAALARDNGFQIIIVIAGTSNLLLAQSTQRLCKDLQVDSDAFRWQSYENPTLSERDGIRRALDGWAPSASIPPSRRKTVMITVLKHHTHLRALHELIRGLGNMERVPVLVIDDEADQASLNTKPTKDRSPTYRCLIELRVALPLHTYLQYTATPQAPLLINILDSLSPNFVQVLDPGAGYCGGRDFFDPDIVLEEELPHICLIPEEEALPSELDAAPLSLLEAMRVFMVGVAAGLMAGESRNRSMLIHPSRETLHHDRYESWIQNIRGEWKETLALGEADPSRNELLEEFRGAHEELCKTVDGLPPFEELAKSLPWAIGETEILTINAANDKGATPTVAWHNSYGWILVSGQAVDRGYTVEGLTVTYMPRGIGVGNADTVQQRARFFGYKRPYFGYCRVYLERETLTAYRNYVEHEKHMRESLQDFQAQGKPLGQWKRAFYLDPKLKPCRDNVIEHGYIRSSKRGGWHFPRAVFETEEITAYNRAVVEDFLGALGTSESEYHHERYTDVPIKKAIERLLERLRVAEGSESAKHTRLTLQLTKALEDGYASHCTVYRMGLESGSRRRRDADQAGKIVSELFQGPTDSSGDAHYPGDRKVRETGQVTIQIHMLDLEDKQSKEKIADDVPVVAVYLPQSLVSSWLVQNQN